MPSWTATCMNCTPVLPIPFGEDYWEENGITDWVFGHTEATGHKVIVARDKREDA